MSFKAHRKRHVHVYCCSLFTNIKTTNGWPPSLNAELNLHNSLLSHAQMVYFTYLKYI